MDVKNVMQYNMQEPIECLDLHLREISLNEYWGWKPDIDFAKFFVMNARVLKVMRFHIIYKHNDNWFATQGRHLKLENNISREADFQFRPLYIYFNKFGIGGVKKVIHDLSVSDPVAASFWPCEMLI